ncbi:MAG TPA: DUF3192 domain-containing protein [Thermodesulfobacteriota bacterium]|nr:DUF3192 domain-containing protein [Thermodesulfobacteriota bacterium]HNU71487.1 DUF3192 domain-containing protein [Thermodesulfobacteriota bacterium]
MRLFGILLALLLISGCATQSENVRIENRENLLRLSVGMKKFEVLQIMGTQTYETINNPYKVETPRGGNGELYEVLFYHTELKNKDDLIADDELTPIVFLDNRLIGWGWAFLSSVVPNYQYQRHIR